MRTSAGFLEIGLSGKMRIQIRPPRLMWRVMARRAASIWRAVKRPRPIALRPYSPKLTLLPVVAMPLLRPFCIFRYFCLAGCSIFRPWLSYFLFRFCGGNSWQFSLVTKHFTLEYPNFDTNNTVGGFSFSYAIINISTQCMQWHTAFAIPFCTSDFNTVQAACTHDLDTLRTQTHCVLHGTLHGTAEHHTLFKLLRNAFSDQGGIDFRLTHFFDVQMHWHTHQALQSRT